MRLSFLLYVDLKPINQSLESIKMLKPAMRFFVEVDNFKDDIIHKIKLTAVDLVRKEDLK